MHDLPSLVWKLSNHDYFQVQPKNLLCIFFALFLSQFRDIFLCMSVSRKRSADVCSSFHLNFCSVESGSLPNLAAEDIALTISLSLRSSDTASHQSKSDNCHRAYYNPCSDLRFAIVETSRKYLNLSCRRQNFYK